MKKVKRIPNYRRDGILPVTCLPTNPASHLSTTTCTSAVYFAAAVRRLDESNCAPARVCGRRVRMCERGGEKCERRASDSGTITARWWIIERRQEITCRNAQSVGRLVVPLLPASRPLLRSDSTSCFCLCLFETPTVLRYFSRNSLPKITFKCATKKINRSTAL